MIVLLPFFGICYFSQVKSTIVDMYSATKASFVEGLAEHASQATIPFLHLSFDLWTAQGSSGMDKYIGKEI